MIRGISSQRLRRPRNNINYGGLPRRYFFGPLATSESNNDWSRCLSTSAPPQEPDKKQKRLARTLYRQLLRWCKLTEEELPLSSFIEPISLAPPQVDKETLEALKEVSDSSSSSESSERGISANVYNLLPFRSRFGSDHLLVSVRNSHELRNLIRAMYRLNHHPTTTPELQKTRVSFAFQTLRTLNELSTSLEDLNEHRKKHMDRGLDTLYHVGQVVQHEQERWRGVIVGWEKPENNSNDEKQQTEERRQQLTSLTTKTYTAGDFLNSTRYEVILDAGDVHMMQATSAFIVCMQNDLKTVTDGRLCRIRSNMISDNFKGFDIRTNAFIPNDMLAYEYPEDHFTQQEAIEDASSEIASPAMAEEVTEQVKKIAHHLYECIELPQDHDKEEKYGLLWAFQKRLSALADGLEKESPIHGVHNLHGNVLRRDEMSTIASASTYLRELLNITLEIRDILWHRQTSKEVSSERDFTLGDVVYHKVFGFRGVVVAFDSKPTVDVSRWDGVQHIDNPLEMPFYHIIPDEQDCIEIFGAPRRMRYVCQQNLETCYKDRCSVAVPLLDPDWIRRVNADGKTTFEAPSEVMFKHGEDIGDDNLTEHYLNKIQDEITNWQVSSRDSPSNDNSLQLPLHRLFELLQNTEKLDDAIAIEETIKEMWKAHSSQDLRKQLDAGIADVLRGKGREALDIFKDLTTKDEHYAEAWNKVAACEYMLGNMQSSLDAAEKALNLMPTHFQALNGVGLCHFDEGKYDLAAESFEKSIDLDPWSPVSSKLAACADMISKQKGVKNSST